MTRRRRKRGRGPTTRAPAAQAARAVADEATETSQPTDRPVPEFEVVGVSHVERAASPTLRFEIEATEATGRSIYTIALTAMIEIEPSKRRYDDAERERLRGAVRRARALGLHHVQPALGPGGGAGPELHRLDPLRTRARRAPTTTRSARRSTSTGLSGGEAPLRFHFNGTIIWEATTVTCS